MTEENKKENIKSELDRASEVLLAADTLFNNGLVKDAISRLYYFLFYNLRALLLMEGFEPKSHEGVLRLFGLHFVKPGVFEPEASHIFTRLMKYREEADYNPFYVFTAEDFVQFRKEAEYLSDKITSYLKGKGYIS